MLCLLGVMKRFDFEKNPGAQSVVDAFGALQAAMAALQEAK